MNVIIGHDKLEWWKINKFLYPNSIFISNYFDNIDWIKYHHCNKHGGIYNHINVKNMIIEALEYEPLLINHSDSIILDDSILKPDKFNFLYRSFSSIPYGFFLTIPSGYHNQCIDIIKNTSDNDHVETIISKIINKYNNLINIIQHTNNNMFYQGYEQYANHPGNGYDIWFDDIKFLHTHNINRLNTFLQYYKVNINEN